MRRNRKMSKATKKRRIESDRIERDEKTNETKTQTKANGYSMNWCSVRVKTVLLFEWPTVAETFPKTKNKSSLIFCVRLSADVFAAAGIPCSGNNGPKGFQWTEGRKKRRRFAGTTSNSKDNNNKNSKTEGMLTGVQPGVFEARMSVLFSVYKCPNLLGEWIYYGAHDCNPIILFINRGLNVRHEAAYVIGNEDAPRMTKVMVHLTVRPLSIGLWMRQARKERETRPRRGHHHNIRTGANEWMIESAQSSAPTNYQ